MRFCYHELSMFSINLYIHLNIKIASVFCSIKTVPFKVRSHLVILIHTPPNLHEASDSRCISKRHKTALPLVSGLNVPCLWISGMLRPG